MRLKNVDGPKVEVEYAIHNPGLVAPWLDFIIPHKHLLDVGLLQTVVFVVQEVDERETRFADGVEALGVCKKINEVRAHAAFVFHISSK
jgi:hypothetical protein